MDGRRDWAQGESSGKYKSACSKDAVARCPWAGSDVLVGNRDGRGESVACLGKLEIGSIVDLYILGHTFVCGSLLVHGEQPAKRQKVVCRLLSTLIALLLSCAPRKVGGFSARTQMTPRNVCWLSRFAAASECPAHVGWPRWLSVEGRHLWEGSHGVQPEQLLEFVCQL